MDKQTAREGSQTATNMNTVLSEALNAEKALTAARERLWEAKVSLGIHFAQVRKDKGLSQRHTENLLFAKGFKKRSSVQKIERPRSGVSHSVETIIEALSILETL